MNESTTNTPEKSPLERCAELATWHQLESDPIQQERIAAELARCVMETAKDEADKRAEQEAKEKAETKEKADADKAAKAEKKEQEAKEKADAEAKAKAAIDAEHAAWEKGMLESQERQRDQEAERNAPQLIRERTIAVPENIRNNPMYQQILEQQREIQARLVSEQAARFAAEQRAVNYQGMRNEARMEAYDAQEKAQEIQQQFEARQDPATPGIEGERDPYAQAANELDAKTLPEGQEIEGEVLDVVNVDGNNYYVVEQDGERLAVPAGDKPEHEKGDDITVSRTKEGFETGEACNYGR